MKKGHGGDKEQSIANFVGKIYNIFRKSPVLRGIFKEGDSICETAELVPVLVELDLQGLEGLCVVVA
jgi:hypothetical protein